VTIERQEPAFEIGKRIFYIDQNIKRLRGTVLSKPIVNKYMYDNVNPGRDNIILMADHSGTSVEWICTGRGPIMRPVDVPIVNINYFLVPDDLKVNEIQEKMLINVEFLPNSCDPFAIVNQEDTFEPLIGENDVLIFDASQKELDEKNLFLFIFNKTLFLRKCIFDGEDISLVGTDLSLGKMIFSKEKMSVSAKCLGKMVYQMRKFWIDK